MLPSLMYLNWTYSSNNKIMKKLISLVLAISLILLIIHSLNKLTLMDAQVTQWITF